MITRVAEGEEGGQGWRRTREEGKRRIIYIYVCVLLALTIGLPSRKPDEDSYFLQMLSIILETCHYYVHLFYGKGRGGEGRFKSIGNH